MIKVPYNYHKIFHMTLFQVFRSQMIAFCEEQTKSHFSLTIFPCAQLSNLLCICEQHIEFVFGIQLIKIN